MEKIKGFINNNLNPLQAIWRQFYYKGLGMVCKTDVTACLQEYECLRLYEQRIIKYSP